MDMSSNIVMVYLDRAVDLLLKHKTKVLAGLGGAVALVLAVMAYQAMQRQKGIEAHQAFIAMIKDFEEATQASRAGKTGKTWEELAKTAEENAEKFSGVKLGTAFLAYQADALIELGKQDDAIALIKKVMGKVSMPALRDYYELKLALMMMDSEQQAVREEGLVRLHKMADNAKHAAHAEALFHAGSFAWGNKKFDEAKNYWQQLVIKYANERGVAEYVDDAKSKLELLSV